MIRYLEIDEILELHFWIIEDFGGSHGVRDQLGLKSLVAAPQQLFLARSNMCQSTKRRRFICVIA